VYLNILDWNESSLLYMVLSCVCVEYGVKSHVTVTMTAVLILQ